MKHKKNQWIYWILWVLFTVVFFLWHPFYKFRNREHIPDDGCMIVANHSSMADPIWILMALGPRRGSYIMAKKEVMALPVLPPILRWLGVFGVDRGGADLAAVKQSLEVLKSGENLMIFPEGTRVKPGETVEAKTGAAMMAQRSGSRVLPVYITRQKKPFHPVEVIFGEPYEIRAAGRRITSDELQTATAQMMKTIYALGAKA